MNIIFKESKHNTSNQLVFLLNKIPRIKSIFTIIFKMSIINEKFNLLILQNSNKITLSRKLFYIKNNKTLFQILIIKSKIRGSLKNLSVIIIYY
jgi:phosphoglycerate-specific signal transduction histidine kinase